MFKFENTTIKRGQQVILENINLDLAKGQIAVLFAPNGSGKTTLAQTICGNNQMQISTGKIILNNQEISQIDSTKRAQLGIFVSFQNPPEIPGVTTINLIKESFTAIKQQKPIAKEFLSQIKEFNNLLGLKADFYKQNFNVGASGGEKKKNELLQMLMLEPKVVILDEVDSGLDTKSKDNLVDILTKFKATNRTILIITHDFEFYQKLKPDKIYTIQNNQIIPI